MKSGRKFLSMYGKRTTRQFSLDKKGHWFWYNETMNGYHYNSKFGVKLLKGKHYLNNRYLLGGWKYRNE